MFICFLKQLIHIFPLITQIRSLSQVIFDFSLEKPSNVLTNLIQTNPLNLRVGYFEF